MMKMNSIEKSRYINSRYKEYLRSSFEFGNGNLQKLFEEQLEKEQLFKGPYVNLNLPFQRGKNIRQLVEEGVVCNSFLQLSDIDFDRPLYSHQEESIRKIKSGRSAIITTGTGSGKTESFLFPILNDILTDLEAGNKEIGIRAIFLYPMNALVNDQIDRVRKILVEYPDISYGFFTGDTKESVQKNYREKLGRTTGTLIPENELVSREEIRSNPPHLLFTNYSMLEYLLIRPNDYAVFESTRLNNWKYVILDEAHSYYGSLGIELSLLMRRLTGLAPRKPRFILTSATLGKQGESEGKIVDFARSLTSVEFDETDIIFSKRINLNEDVAKYTLQGEEYVSIKNSLEQNTIPASIKEKYNCTNCNSNSETLFELLRKDKNVIKLYKLLKEESLSFSTIARAYEGEVQPDEIVALIDLINMAEKDGIGLFDLKYHSFVRPLVGAYVSFGKDQKLSLTKTNLLGDMKAFEIGNCRFCSTPYLIGKIQVSNEDGLQYLYQNKEVDIYENYGYSQFVKIDYFLLDLPTEEDDIDKDLLEGHTLCTKCGCINASANLTARKCRCGSEFEKIVYRVTQNNEEGDEYAFNNINHCPCCGHKARSGVVKGLNIGKDEGTALIAQMLYESIDEGEKRSETVKKLSLRPTAATTENKKEEKVKQFLAFSDSRQQASFFAAFYESNHTRMLRKRLIWEILVEHNYQEVKVDELTAYLTDKINRGGLFPNNLSSTKNAWLAVMIDLLKVDGAYDGEGLGLYYFDLDISDIMDSISDEDFAEEFGEYNITKSEFETIIKVVLGTFKTVPAINYVKSTLTREEKEEYLEFRQFDNYVTFQKQRNSKDTSVRSFLPVNGKENYVVRYVEKVLSVDFEKAKEILSVIFNNIAVTSSTMDCYEKFLIKRETKEEYQIDVGRFIVRNYKSSKYYQCSKCKRLTPYNVHNFCPQDGCNGTLQECDPDEVLGNNYYRKQYKTKKIEKIVIQEHTAQLERKRAKEYQDDFKNKKINILSCSTTFEMGIDIGNLETVFMRNVPPTPANYVQRAGRAGRRKDSAAYILTYCGAGSHDYTYFSEPEKMISGVINPPYFNVLNRKIIVRHLMATCLGFFFRENPLYFESLDEFVFGNGLNAFHSFMARKPVNLVEYIDNKILLGGVYSDYHDLKWYDTSDEEVSKLDRFAEEIKGLQKEYSEAMQRAVNDQNWRDADYYKKQIESLHDIDVVKALSSSCVIPKYGFPVDVVQLEIYKNGRKDNSYDLSRDLSIALSEYAPDSEVFVDKIKYTSKYITLPRTSPFVRHYFFTCDNCRKVNVYSVSDAGTCKYCGEPISTAMSEYYIEPSLGFKTGENKETGRLKPRRSYAGEVTYLGFGLKDDDNLRFSDIITIETSSDDELLVLNRSRFKVCPVCGYGEIQKKGNIIPISQNGHDNYKQFTCDCKQLEQLRLGHTFKTDVARFTIPILDSSSEDAYAKALSFMYAFLEGISNALGIERKDINGVLELNFEKQSYDVLVYDNVPGGAGHVKRLVVGDNTLVRVLEEARVKVSQECCDENTSCYNCLRNYNNQSYHNKLKRVYARNYIDRLLCIKDIKPTRFSNKKESAVLLKGTKKSNYVFDSANSSSESTIQCLNKLLTYTEDESAKKGIQKLIDYAENKIIEKPLIDRCIELDVAVWPDLFWGKSQVAIFLPDNSTAYDRLKPYDWYCFIVTEDIDPKAVFDHIESEG